MFARILRNTINQIQRSGWVGWGSVSVMTLAFLVASVFSGLVYFAHLWIEFIETRSNVLVFFEVGMDREIINRLKQKWESLPQVKQIDFTSEERAFEMFADFAEKTLPIVFLTLNLNKVTGGKLPSSLDIQIRSLDDLASLKEILVKDIERENENLRTLNLDEKSDQENNKLPIYKYSTKEGEPPIDLKVDSESLDKLKVVMLTLRVMGISIIILLFIVIFFFTFMTVEFRLYNQMEEIGVMQLVGGSLFFIRAPYILEGGFYGMFGALLSCLMLGILILIIFIAPTDLAITQFFFENFSQLNWPYISTGGWAIILAVFAFTGFLLGAVNTWLAIKRYIR